MIKVFTVIIFVFFFQIDFAGSLIQYIEQRYDNKTFQIEVPKGTIKVLFTSDVRYNLRGFHLTFEEIFFIGIFTYSFVLQL